MNATHRTEATESVSTLIYALSCCPPASVTSRLGFKPMASAQAQSREETAEHTGAQSLSGQGWGAQVHTALAGAGAHRPPWQRGGQLCCCPKVLGGDPRDQRAVCWCRQCSSEDKPRNLAAAHIPRGAAPRFTGHILFSLYFFF